ncbi:hypothetical protein ABZ345_42700 [Lentzea sp. NPDC005914]|uniref:hypothetical protein n=1 Tax=Lentzea sp. NPDC005914 TaxID=3154572 RepID=UPI0033DC1350
MAWTEKIGPRSWRVRYLRGDSGYGSISGFETKTAADAYATQLEADQRRGTWLDPKAGLITTAEWAALWADTLDVEIRTEENYRGRIRNHIQPRWGTIRLGAITPLAGHLVGQATASPLRHFHSRRHPDRVLHDARRRR